MSTDPSAIAALAAMTGCELRYFELVTLRFSTEPVQCYLCLGLFGIYFVRRSLQALYPDDANGEIYYAQISGVCEDVQSPTDMLIWLGENRSEAWSDKLFVVSEHRFRLLEHIELYYRTDYMWRFGKRKDLLIEKRPLRNKPSHTWKQVKPFPGHKVARLEGYSFFIPESYEEEVEERDLKGTLRFVDRRRQLELCIEVSRPVALEDLEAAGLDHIRWVATEFKLGVAARHEEPVFFRNAFRVKRMNLACDIACWTGWELLYNSESCSCAIALLRRQYLPPLLDTAQDISLRLVRKLPESTSLSSRSTNPSARSSLQAKVLRIVPEDHSLHDEVCHIADTFAPLVNDCTVYQSLYREIIQAKLDSLHYNEDAMKWLSATVGLDPVHKSVARKFIKAIVVLLQEESAFSKGDLVGQLTREGDTDDHTPLSVAYSLVDTVFAKSISHGKTSEQAVLSIQSDGSVFGGIADSATLEQKMIRNAWSARVARYLAYCVDGGFVGSQFTLTDLTAVDTGLLSETNQKIVLDLIYFLLHLRPRDLTQEYDGKRLLDIISLNDFKEYTFNDHVMQSLLELGWLAKVLEPRGEGDSRDYNYSYARVLSQLLSTPASSVSLKAAVCREVIKTSSITHVSTIVPSLVLCLQTTSVFLKSYVTATLVNVTNGVDVAKAMLVDSGILEHCAEQLLSKDEECVQYTLTLLTNLSKTPNHRARIGNTSLVTILLKLLLLSERIGSKPQVLAELASVIGQICNEIDIWKQFVENEKKDPSGSSENARDYTVPSDAVQSLVNMYTKSVPRSKLCSKAMFALKQVCGHVGKVAFSVRYYVAKLVPRIVNDLNDICKSPPPLAAQDLDCAANAIMLLLVLSTTADGLKLMENNDLAEVLTAVCATELYASDATRPRIIQLQMRLKEMQDDEYQNGSKSNGNSFSITTPSNLNRASIALTNSWV